MSDILPAKLIRNLYRKRDLMREGRDHHHIRPVLLILGGGMGGASGVGIVSALHRLGLGNVFDAVIGISTGATVGAYFLNGAKSTWECASIYYEDLPKKFVNYLRKPVADIDFAESIARTGSRKIKCRSGDEPSG